MTHEAAQKAQPARLPNVNTVLNFTHAAGRSCLLDLAADLQGPRSIAA